MNMIAPHAEWLEARGITQATADRFGLHTHQEGRYQWLRVPFLEGGQAVNHKWRKTRAKEHRMDAGAPLLLFNAAALAEAARTGDPLLVTEGEWDALVAIQCGHELTTSVPNGAPSEQEETNEAEPWERKRYEWFQRHREHLDQITKFILAADGDEAGARLLADLARLLGPERCRWVEYPEGCKDLNDVLLQHGEQAVMACIETAKDYPVPGLYKLDDFPEPPSLRSYSIGIDGLDELWPLVPGTFSVVTGWPGHGKSSLTLSAIANLMMGGMNVVVGSFETMVKPVLQRRLRACVYQCGEKDQPAMRRGPADDLFNDRLHIISNLNANDDTELTIEAIIDAAITAVIRSGAKLLVLDPWNEIEHQMRREENETQYVGRAIRLLKRFARDYQCAVWVVAHPRKPSSDGAPKRPSLLDLAGSANFANKADYGVICHRDDLTSCEATVTVVKKRMGLAGAMGQRVLEWDESRSSYWDTGGV